MLELDNLKVELESYRTPLKNLYRSLDLENKENRIMKKLRSDVGASITFGLLLFLVCAVISAVVLVAGTTAAGRLSGMSKTEQRYYSVTSTAKLIQEELEGGSESAVAIEAAIISQLLGCEGSE